MSHTLAPDMNPLAPVRLKLQLILTLSRTLANSQQSTTVALGYSQGVVLLRLPVQQPAAMRRPSCDNCSPISHPKAAPESSPSCNIRAAPN